MRTTACLLTLALLAVISNLATAPHTAGRRQRAPAHHDTIARIPTVNVTVDRQRVPLATWSHLLCRLPA